jgi:NhaP-type Na+/H+ or K+/H+ antiporter
VPPEAVKYYASSAPNDRRLDSSNVNNTIGYLIFGALLICMGLVGSSLKRLPLNAAMLYLGLGCLMGLANLDVLLLKLPEDATRLRMAAEVGLLISLFAIGLRLRVPPNDPRWMLPLRLGILAMVFCVALVAAFGVLVLGLSVGVAVLLGAILAPTDPVLAHDVGVREPGDVELVRFSLSGEGGVNDGSAYPFVLLGLLLCGFGNAPSPHWMMALEVAWGVAAGAGSGWLLGFATARLVAFLRSRHRQALGLEGCFALGLLMLSYGVALAINSYGFLAVFAAGVAMRRVEHRSSGRKTSKEVIGVVDIKNVDATSTHPEKAPAFVAESVMGFTIELEHIAEAFLIVLTGMLVAQYWPSMLSWSSVGVVAALLLFIRPAATQLAMLGCVASHRQRRLISWFGIRGVGSLYYLMLALERGPREDLLPLIPCILSAITVSILLHGISATPLMRRYA